MYEGNKLSLPVFISSGLPFNATKVTASNPITIGSYVLYQTYTYKAEGITIAVATIIYDAYGSVTDTEWTFS